jgi:hypothetical protein
MYSSEIVYGGIAPMNTIATITRATIAARIARGKRFTKLAIPAKGLIQHMTRSASWLIHSLWNIYIISSISIPAISFSWFVSLGTV